MLINADSLRTLFILFNGLFKDGMGMAVSHAKDVASFVPSAALEEEYGWLGLFPQLRQWLGDRIVHSLTIQSYRIKNADYELTISVPRNNIQDDRVGIFAPMFKEMGRGVVELPDRLLFGLLSVATSAPCYDGQNFFDTDHPVLNENGQVYSVSNYQGGASDAPTWYLLDTSRAIRPLIYQERQPFTLTAKDKPSDDNVFWQKDYVYGTDGRCNAGYGLWQLAYASKLPLTAENYEAARNAMTALRGDYDHRLGIMPNKLVVPTALEGAGRRLLNTPLKSQSTTVLNPGGGGGDIIVTGAGSNEWAGSADLIVTPWL